MFINYRSVFMRKGPYWDSSGKDFYATLRNFYLETMSSENPIFTMPDEEAVSLYLSYSDKSVGWKARNLRYLEVLGENEGGDSLHKLYACLKCSKYEVGLHSPVLLRLAELLKAYPESTNYQALMLASDADLSLADYPEFEKMPLSYQDKMSHITPPIKTPENWVYDFKLEKLETLEF
jgi:hypothetical protein